MALAYNQSLCLVELRLLVLIDLPSVTGECFGEVEEGELPAPQLVEGGIEEGATCEREREDRAEVERYARTVRAPVRERGYGRDNFCVQHDGGHSGFGRGGTTASWLDEKHL